MKGDYEYNTMSVHDVVEAFKRYAEGMDSVRTSDLYGYMSEITGLSEDALNELINGQTSL